MTLEKNAHCSYCGQRFAPQSPWPRTCAGCQRTSFLNPLPVSVVVVPVTAATPGVLLIRRAIPPRVGQLALPGGYIGVGESWQEAGAREVFEETGVRLDPARIHDFTVRSAPDGTVLIFGLSEAIAAGDLPPFEPGPGPLNETAERVVVTAPVELAFPLHTDVLRRFFAR